MPEEINLRGPHCDEVHDIIGHPPSWVVRRGIIVMGGILSLLLLSTWFIRYPEIVSVPVTISSANPPVKITAFSNGMLRELYARDGEQVTAGQAIAVIDNQANTEDMFLLKKSIQKLDTIKEPEKLSLPANIQVGELQADYTALQQAISEGVRSANSSNIVGNKWLITDRIKKIKAQIGAWEKQYVLTSPVPGKLIFFRVCTVNQYVKNGEQVFLVVPDSKTNEYILRAQVSATDAGKIKPGQSVLIKLQEYPYEEFGMLNAQVAYITNVAMDSMR